MDDGLLQYIPNEPIDFTEKLTVNVFDKFEEPSFHLLIVGSTLYEYLQKLNKPETVAKFLEIKNEWNKYVPIWTIK